MDMDISMDIHAKSVDMDMDMDGKSYIHNNPGDIAVFVLQHATFSHPPSLVE